MLISSPFLGPVVASVLYVIVFQRAGFAAHLRRGGRRSGAVPTRILVYDGHGGGPAAGVFLLSAALSLAPLIVSAFMAWPPATVPAADFHGETPTSTPSYIIIDDVEGRGRSEPDAHPGLRTGRGGEFRAS